MLKTQLLIIVLIVLGVGTKCAAQKECNQWIFGKFGALDFNSTPPTVLSNSTFTSYEGGSSISDANGNLLFYTDGETVWNQFHTVMANGTGLLGNQSTTQSCIILKQPGINTLYYIFTQAAVMSQAGFQYSIVDMSLSSGSGSVTVKNNFLYQPSCEKLHAVKPCNSTDYWIVTHEYNTNNFRAYLLTSMGLNTVPVVSSVGSTVGINSVLGQLKLSPNGKKLAMARFQGVTLDLFDFDGSTGIVSNHIALPNPSGSYNCEFSPDGTKLYAGNGTIYQWDVCSTNSMAVINSSFAVYSNTTSFYGSMQLASDGRIYLRATSTDSLAVITKPNLPGVASGFSLNLQPVGNCTLQLGLPNFPANLFRSAPPFNYSANCTSVTFSVPNSNGCSASTAVNNYLWTFGDATSGTANTSTQTVVTHTFSAQGTYTVKLKLFSECGTDSTQITLPVNGPSISIISNSNICAGQSSTLQAYGSLNYSWSTGASTSSIVVTPSVTTQYTVTGSNNSGCPNPSVSQQITVNSTPTLSINSVSSVCIGQSVTFNVSGANTYTWNTGFIGSTFSILPTSLVNYTVHGTGENGCTNSTTVSVNIEVCTDLLNHKIISYKVFPNPSNGSICITSGQEMKLILLSESGSFICKFELSSNNGHTFILPQLSSGIYVLYDSAKTQPPRRLIIHP